MRSDPKEVAKECLGAFYELSVRWIRGLDENQDLKKKWTERVASRTFSLVDTSGRLWKGDSWLTEELKYGSGATWSMLNVELRNLEILQQRTISPSNQELVLAVVEVWHHQCHNDTQGQEVTARRATAWIQREAQPNNVKGILLHLQETWLEGHAPVRSKAFDKDAELAAVADVAVKEEEPPPVSATATSWRQTNIPSKRRHISERLEEFNAKPLLWDHQLVGISIHGWDIGTSQGPIGREAWFSQATTDLEELCQYKLQTINGGKRRIGLPEMVFPAAHVALERTKGDLFVSWDAMDALKEWGEAHQAIPIPANEEVLANSPAFRGVAVLKVSDAKLWKGRVGPLLSAGKKTPAKGRSATFHYDWTFSTPFCGTTFGVAASRDTSGGWRKMETSGMPMQLLTDQSVPILLFDDVILYEDDLHDNGQVQLTVKMRVMPTCAYVLSKLFCRVDNVLVRVRECRLLVDFAANKLYRDVTWRECAWGELAKHKLPHDLNAWTPTDANKDTPAFLHLCSKLPQVELPRDLHQYAELLVRDFK